MSRALRLGITMLSALALTLCVASAAHAQVVVNPNPGSGGRPVIRDYQPRSGPPGTRVLVRGGGFTPYTQIVIGDQPVGTYQITGNQLEFIVPPQGWNGEIRLRHPGVPDFSVGRFQMVRGTYYLGDFHPRGGAPGSRVELRGSGFQPGYHVYFNGRRLSVMEMSGTRMVVVIPPGARTDYFTVRRPDGLEVYSPRPFFVSRGNWMPTVGGFYPQEARPGDRVTIAGTGFHGDARVFVGGQPARVLHLTPTSIGFVVPQAQDGTVALRFPGLREIPVGRLQMGWGGPRPPGPGPGPGPGPAPYPVPNAPPIITSLQPAFGPPGTLVAIRGSRFGPNARVFYGRVEMHIARREPSLIEAQVPANARRAEYIVVRGRRGTARSPQPFRIARQAELQFQPQSAYPGQRVSLHGVGWRSGDQVTLAGQTLRVTHLDPRRIEVAIPPRARSGPFAVHRRGRLIVQSRDTFQVLHQGGGPGYGRPRADSFVPNGGPPGTRVVVHGDNLRDATATYGRFDMQIVDRRDRRIEVIIPEQARRTNPIVLTTPQGTAQTAQQFQLTRAGGPGPGHPVGMSHFAPKVARPGHAVKIFGRGFSGDARVYFGSLPCRITRLSPTEIRFEVPHNAVGQDYVTLEDGGQRLRSHEMLRLRGR
jgi:hypothetical protein